MPTWKEFLEQCAVIAQAPIPFALILIVIGGVMWIAANWAYGSRISNRDSTIALLERQRDDYKKQVDQLQQIPAVPVTAQLAEAADLVLRSYGDERAPTRISYDNIWRWYYLRTIQIAVELGTGKEHRNAIASLFVTFEKPVAIGTLEVSSPDFQLPPYEVKEFTNRYAIIVFTGELPSGTLHLRVY